MTAPHTLAAPGPGAQTRDDAPLPSGRESRTVLERLATASDWHHEVQRLLGASERRAWRVALGAGALAAIGMAHGLFMAMQPAPSPKVLMLDRMTGETVVLPDLDGRQVPQVVALDHHNAAVYVRSRESYNYSMLGRDYEQVARMSTPEAWAPYARRFTGPEALHEKRGDKELHRVTVISVRLSSGYVPGRQGESLLTYEREVRTPNGPAAEVTRHVATVRYEYRPTSMKRQVDRIENPFGFVVLAYRSDQEIAASRVLTKDAPDERRAGP